MPASHPEPALSIEIWSDVVCPWCYVGKRRLEQALAGFPHADAVEVVYRSFQLDPTTPTPATERVEEVLARKYGGGLAGAREMIDRMSAVAETEGLEFHLDRALSSNTADAHRLLHLALAEGGPRLQGDLKEALLLAYFTRTEDVADHDVLRKVAADAGLDAGRVEEVLSSDAYADDVRADLAQAQALGATGVPFVVVDRRYGVSGAQPAEVFREVLDRAWADRHPGLAMVATAEGAAADACGPDGCAV